MSENERRSSRTPLTKLREMHRRRAQERARKVPATALAPWIARYIDWLAFVLWARAIVESQRTIPRQVQAALRLRCPGFTPGGADGELWLRLSSWIDQNVFAQPNTEGWMDAVVYYASRDLGWEQLWLYWEHCDDTWQNARPRRYPSFEKWGRQAQEWRFRSSSRNGSLSEGAHLVSPAELRKAVSDYQDWEAFAYWIRSAMKAHRGMSPMVAGRLTSKCPEFLEQLRSEGVRTGDSTIVWRRLIGWVDDHVFGSAKAAGWFEAIPYFARRTIWADRIVAYWAACDRRWSRRRPAECPDFDQWRREAHSYVER